MIMRNFFHDEFLPQGNFLRFLSKYGCDQNFAEKEICAELIFLICGYDPEQFDYTLLPVILNHDPAGASTKTVLHYIQGYQSGKFRQYDYGHEKNLVIYNSPEPPDYDLVNITVPIALFYGPGDWLVNIIKLYRLLPKVMYMYEVPWPKFSHSDFTWAKDAPKLVYKRVLKLMKERNLNNTTSVG
ncbi:Lipase 3 [Formica fusca]